MDTLDKLPQKYRDRIIVEAETACWLWQKNINKAGYGHYQPSFRGKTYRAHRLIFELVKGHIPDGLEIDHKCRVKNCVNPEHLELVTHAENCRRSPLNMLRKSHCRNGHEFDGENTLWVRGTNGRPYRQCRVCNRASGQRQRDKKRGWTG